MKNEPPHIIIGRNIQMLSNQMHLPLKSLAAFLDISYKDIRAIESGRKILSFDGLQKLANLFCVNEYDLYTENLTPLQLIPIAIKGNKLHSHDLNSIAKFRKIVRNYINIKNQIGLHDYQKEKYHKL